MATAQTWRWPRRFILRWCGRDGGSRSDMDPTKVGLRGGHHDPVNAVVRAKDHDWARYSRSLIGATRTTVSKICRHLLAIRHRLLPPRLLCVNVRRVVPVVDLGNPRCRRRSVEDCWRMRGVRQKICSSVKLSHGLTACIDSRRTTAQLFGERAT